MQNSAFQTQNLEDKTFEFWVKDIIINYEGQEQLCGRAQI